MNEVIKTEQTIQDKIFTIRNLQVMLDRDLAELYQVETKRLNEQVKRNIERFDEDFMFQLTDKEFQYLRSQFATTKFRKVRTFKDAHDRFMIIDGNDVYHIGASLKDLGKKWFAFSKMELGSLEILGRLK